MIRKILFIFIRLLICEHSYSQCSSPCGGTIYHYPERQPVGKPYTGSQSSGDTWMSVDRYIARSIFLEDLAGMYMNGYCADFKSNVDMCTNLNAAYLSRVATLWGNEGGMAEGACYYNAAKQAVIEIDNAYNAQHLRQPVIEAAILEYISDGDNGVEAIPIPKDVLKKFQSLYPDVYKARRYPDSMSSTPIFFNRNNIVYKKIPRSLPGNSNFDYRHTPDISRIETQMYYYYLATRYIDMGYTALHMGNYEIVSYNDAPDYAATMSLFTAIRNYAYHIKGTKVLFMNADIYDIYYNNDGSTLLFDFNSSPIRPDESLTYSLCSNYKGLPCQDERTTELHFTSNNEMVLSHGGISPSGEVYDHTPTLFNIDWAACWNSNGYIYGSQQNNGYTPYGYEETTWFATLSHECQAYWLENVACALKNDIGNRLYLKLPGIEVMTCHDLLSYMDTAYDVNGCYEFMFANNALQKAIKDVIWKPNDWLDFTVTTNCDVPTGSDMNSNARKYILKVTNPDCTSVYSWHVQQLNGGWLPFTYGNERILDTIAHEPGTYKFFLRQDNFGFENEDAAGDLKDVQVLEKDWNITNDPCEPLHQNKLKLPRSDSSCCYIGKQVK